MVLSEEDSTRASWLALLGVAVLYFVVYRGCRYPLLTVATLVVGTLWALGWATLTVGHLNILSATFAVMLIGLGDYGVLWVARYDEARRARRVGRGGAAAHRAPRRAEHPDRGRQRPALAFFATMLADFKAVAELGWIAGSGVLFCAASCLVLMPALLVLAESKANSDREEGGGHPLPHVGVAANAALPLRLAPRSGEPAAACARWSARCCSSRAGRSPSGSPTTTTC